MRDNFYPRHYKSLATVNATLLRGSPARLNFLHATNIGAAAAFLKVYDKATAPAATDTPKLVIRLAATTGNERIPFPSGLFFENGLGIRITGALADNDATAVGADEVVVNYGIA